MARLAAPVHAAVEAAMPGCGITAFADPLVETMSGGKRQRARRAMMVAQPAGTLLLDEPILALAIARQLEVLSLVRRMCQDQVRAAIVMLHQVNMAARFCDHGVAMKAGWLARQGLSQEFLQPDRLARIYGLPLQVLRRADGGPVAVPA